MSAAAPGRSDKSLANLRPFDGPTLSILLTGKQVAECYKSNELLVIRMTNGDEIRVAWVDDGKPVKGEPAIAFFGRQINAKLGTMNKRAIPL